MEIFVFGSNRQGRHGKGAALMALLKYGAIHGQAEGLQGQSYAIITKDLRKFPYHKQVTVEEIKRQVERFLDFAASHPDWVFNVTPIGCGLAGFKPEEIAPLFIGCPDNVKLPYVFRKVIAV